MISRRGRGGSMRWQQRSATNRERQAMDTHTEELGRSVAGALDGFRSAAEAMVEAASGIGEGAQRIQETVSRTLDGANGSASDLNAVAASAQDLVAGINEINRQVIGAASAMQAAVQRAADGDGKTSGLSHVAEQLTNVVTLLGEVAGTVKRQAAAARDISAIVQTAIASNAATAEGMREVLAIAEATHASSTAASRGAQDIAHLVETLSHDVVDFLPAAPLPDESKLRLYERLRASGFEVTLRVAGRAPVQASLLDISRVGIAAQYQAEDPIGTEVEVELPSGGTVNGRIARIAEGVTGIAFPADNDTLVEVDRTLHLLILSGVGAAA